jgi:uncharacterized protein (DUF924 family)
MAVTISANAVHEFWFADSIDSHEMAVERVPLWFGTDEHFDRAIESRFADLPELGSAGELEHWLGEPRSLLSLVIGLDQFPRNLFRDTKRCYEYDAIARHVAEQAVARGFDDLLEPLEAVFLYLPFEHSEMLSDQEKSIALFRGLEDRVSDEQLPMFEQFSAYAVRHYEIIVEFGRFPHRNHQLGREFSDHEAAFLEAGGDRF